MEIKINKEVRSYTESIFFGLSPRQFRFHYLSINDNGKDSYRIH